MIELTITALGLLAAVHAICTANCMPRQAPLSVAVEIVLMFGFSVGTVVSCYNGEPMKAWAFLIITLIFKMVSVIDMMLRGYPIVFSLAMCAVFRRTSDWERRHYPRVDRGPKERRRGK